VFEAITVLPLAAEMPVFKRMLVPFKLFNTERTGDCCASKLRIVFDDDELAEDAGGDCELFELLFIMQLFVFALCGLFTRSLVNDCD
jgi:hypothetical protein